MVWTKKSFEPRVLLPLLISAAALTAAFSISDISEVWGYVTNLTFPIVATVFVFAGVYLVVKWTQFHYLLEKSEVRATWKETALAFVVGEMAVPIPAGVYIENYVLARMGRAGTRSTAATTVTLITELVVCFAVLFILGVPGWWWLRPAIVFMVTIPLLSIAAFVLFKPLRGLANRKLNIGPLKRAHQRLMEPLSGLVELTTWEVAAHAIPMAALYLGTIVAGFTLVGHGIGVSRLTYTDAAAIYLFSLTATLSLPISAHLGIMELGGVGAAVALGYSYNEGLAMMLGARLVWTGSKWLMGAATAFLLRGEIAAGTRRVTERATTMSPKGQEAQEASGVGTS